MTVLWHEVPVDRSVRTDKLYLWLVNNVGDPSENLWTWRQEESSPRGTWKISSPRGTWKILRITGVAFSREEHATWFRMVWT